MIEQFWLANKIRFALATDEDVFVAEFSGDQKNLGSCRLSYKPIYVETEMQDYTIKRKFIGFRPTVRCELIYARPEHKGNFEELLRIINQLRPITINLNFDDDSDLLPLEGMLINNDIEFEKLFHFEECGQTIQLTFIKSKKELTVPLLTILWDGYNEGPYDDELYNA